MCTEHMTSDQKAEFDELLASKPRQRERRIARVASLPGGEIVPVNN